MEELLTNLNRNYKSIADYRKLLVYNCDKWLDEYNQHFYISGYTTILTGVEQLEREYCSKKAIKSFLAGIDNMVSEIYLFYQLQEKEDEEIERINRCKKRDLHMQEIADKVAKMPYIGHFIPSDNSTDCQELEQSLDDNYEPCEGDYYQNKEEQGYE